jgi:Ca2+-binding EF-hand superfamily protein
MGNFVSAFSTYFLKQNELAFDRESIEDMLLEMDEDGDGYIDQREFTEFCLVKYGLVPKHILFEIRQSFDDFDEQGEGRIDLSNLKHIMEHDEHDG